MPGAASGRPPRGSFRGSLLLLAALVAVALVGSGSPWMSFAADAGGRRESDFQILRAAARGLLEQRDIHDPSVLDEIGRQDGRPTTPFCAANPLVVRAFGWLAQTPLPAAYGRMLLVQAALALAAVLLLCDVLRRLAVPGAAALALALVALGLPEAFWMSVAMNSTNLLGLVAVLAALRAACAEHPLREGLWLALAVVAKTSPALLLVVAAFAGRWRTLLGGCLGLAGFSALSIAWSGWEVHASWLTRVLPALGYAPELASGHFENSLHAWNLAPNGLLTRSLVGSGGPRLLAWLLAWLVTALVLFQLASAVRRRAPASRDEAARVATDARGVGASDVARRRLWEYALNLAATLLVSSVSWPHHLVFLTPALALLVLERVRGAGRPALSLGLAAALLLGLPLGSFEQDAALAWEGPLRTALIVVLFTALLALEPGRGLPHGGDPTQGGLPGDELQGGGPAPGRGAPA